MNNSVGKISKFLKVNSSVNARFDGKVSSYSNFNNKLKKEFNYSVASVENSFSSSENIISPLKSDLTTNEKILLNKLSKLPETGKSFFIGFSDQNNISVTLDDFEVFLKKEDSLFSTFSELKDLLKNRKENLSKTPIFYNSLLERVISEYREVQKKPPLNGVNIKDNFNFYLPARINDEVSLKSGKDLNINVLSTKNSLRSSERINFNDYEGKVFNKISNSISSDYPSKIEIKKSGDTIFLFSNGTELFSGHSKKVPLIDQFATETFTRNGKKISADNYSNAQREFVGIINRMSFLKSRPQVTEFAVSKNIKDEGYSISITPIKLVEKIKEIIEKNPDLLEKGVLTRIHNFKDEDFIIKNFSKDSSYKYSHEKNEKKSLVNKNLSKEEHKFKFDSKYPFKLFNEDKNKRLVRSDRLKDFSFSTGKSGNIDDSKPPLTNNRKIINISSLKDIEVSQIKDESEAG
ncbi:MAG: hypothetical protein CR982_09940 [Candidatus Cloacimonadota bacterium]|nr:MAG: hypothetical protein CR982_09940 [Candidatus Cloacimonadota bacterium]PIE78425.1 MAG: hypothetical protein CSA15_07895 [Candidatus Delongbacteria bacterium]